METIMEAHMKSIVAKSGSEAQDAGAFILVEEPIPEPGTQDLLVRVVAIGMNPVDTRFAHDLRKMVCSAGMPMALSKRRGKP